MEPTHPWVGFFIAAKKVTGTHKKARTTAGLGK